MRRDTSGADGGREKEQPGGQATPPRQEGGRDRGGERRVVRGEAVVRGVREERGPAVDDEGAWIGPDVGGDLDPHDREHDGQDADTGEGELLWPGDLQPDERSGDRDEEDGIRGHDNDQ